MFLGSSICTAEHISSVTSLLQNSSIFDNSYARSASYSVLLIYSFRFVWTVTRNCLEQHYLRLIIRTPSAASSAAPSQTTPSGTSPEFLISRQFWWPVKLGQLPPNISVTFPDLDIVSCCPFSKHVHVKVSELKRYDFKLVIYTRNNCIVIFLLPCNVKES